MKNADMPAMPMALETMVDEHGTVAVNDAYEGLTKREMFAMHAMQGFASLDFDTVKAWVKAADSNDTASMFAKVSIEYADALLKELEK